MYRCVCIYETYSSPRRVEVRIEVCQGSHTKSLSPFIRKVDVDTLAQNCVPESKPLLPLMNQMGMIKQPFRLSGMVLENAQVQDILQRNPWCGVQNNGKGSVKNLSPVLPLARKRNLSKGVLLGGELYITNIVNWNKNIKIRLSYQNAITSFFPKYNACPYLSSEGTLFLRDEVKERELLSELLVHVDLEKGEMTLDGYDMESLGSLAQKGWKVFVEKAKGTASQVYLRRHSSGIEWFSSTEKETVGENSLIDQMLNSYLQGRNYVDSKGNLSLFRAKDITQVEPETISESLPSFNWQTVYGRQISLSSSEEKQIRESISNGVNAKLRSYQLEGVRWLATMRITHHGCLLADEMGLGKTLQVLSHLYALGKTDMPHLVIAPTSLVYNWQSEIKKFIPSWENRIGVQLHSPDKTKQLLIVSYDILRLNIDKYRQIEYDTIIIDEAQIIKNRETQKYKAIKTLKSLHHIILTGTPIENSIDDIWSHFMILMPGMKTLYTSLNKRCQSKTDESFLELSRKFLKPFILRRTKLEVLKDLPKLIEKTVYVEMSSAERHLYDNVHKMVLRALSNGVSGRIESIALEGLLRLRQACVSPVLLPHSLYKSTNNSVSSKLLLAMDYIETFREKGEKVLVFSQFVGALEEMEKILAIRGFHYEKIYGETRDRVTPIERFQKSKDISVFLISLKAGGVGLNLTAASNVILLDDWWNPAVEDQAFARAHRIGQQKNVMVFRLICKDTVEEKVLQLQEKKKQTIDMFNAAGAKLSIDEIKGLLN